MARRVDHLGAPTGLRDQLGDGVRDHPDALSGGADRRHPAQVADAFQIALEPRIQDLRPGRP
jgi:hypothetical protein